MAGRRYLRFRSNPCARSHYFPSGLAQAITSPFSVSVVPLRHLHPLSPSLYAVLDYLYQGKVQTDRLLGMGLRHYLLLSMYESAYNLPGRPGSVPTGPRSSNNQHKACYFVKFKSSCAQNSDESQRSKKVANAM